MQASTVVFPFRYLRWLPFVLAALVSTLGAPVTQVRGAVAQNSCATITRALSSGDVYICPSEIADNGVRAGDSSKLNDAVRAATNAGVPTKIAISEFPSKYADAYAAARAMRHFLDFHGVFVLVAPGRRSMGVSADTLTLDQIRAIEAQARTVCATGRYADCAVVASQAATSRIKSARGGSGGSTAVIWILVVVVLAGIGAVVVWRFLRRRRGDQKQLEDMRTAASNTLSLADNAVESIEGALSVQQPEADVRADYDRALALRDRARTELERASSAPMLTQANQDAAQAVLALQGVMRKAGIQSPLANPLESPGRRCFYCAHDDRPPYTQQAIDDGRGNSMQIDVCSVCAAQLAQGRRPQVATVNYNNTMVPWWAVPANPWYYNYGGPTWQYWLPLAVGMDIGMWYGGGWEYGEGGYGDWGGDSQSFDSGSTVDPASDMGSGDFGGWGGDSAGTGGDSGGWDSGGDSGGWGGDSGGGDSGGW